jgi:hypothetical protein
LALEAIIAALVGFSPSATRASSSKRLRASNSRSGDNHVF